MSTENATILSQLLGDSDAKMSIHQCERIAKDLVCAGKKPDEIAFDIVGPKGRQQCRWLDPYIGFFRFVEHTGFVRVSDIEMYHGLYIENVDVETAATEDTQAKGEE